MREEVYAAPKTDVGSAAAKQGTEGSTPWLRLAISLACVAFARGSQHVLLPVEGLDALHGIGETPNASIGALGVAPFIAAAVLVELVSLTRRRWRQSRVSGEALRVWDRASLALGIVVAALQALAVSYVLEGIVSYGGYFELTVNRPLVIVALVGGSLFHVGLAYVIERRGLGNGFAWMLFGGYAISLVTDGRAALNTGQGFLIPVLVALALVVVFVIVVGVAPLWEGLQHPSEGASVAPALDVRHTPALRMFPCGYVNAFGATLVTYLTLAPTHALWFDLLLVWPLGLGFAIAFQPATRISNLRRALGVSRTDVGQLRRLRLGYTLLTIALVSTLILLKDSYPDVARWIVLLPISCFLLDIVGELRAGTLGITVRIRSLQRVYAADAAVEALAGEGIPAYVRGVHLRSLFHTLGPYLPLALFVEERFAERARQVLGEGFDREQVS